MVDHRHLGTDVRGRGWSWSVPFKLILGAVALVVAIPIKLIALPFEGPIKRTRQEVAEILQAFLDGTLSDAAWDDFVSIEIADPLLDAIRKRCETLYDEFPPAPGERSSLDEQRVIRELAEQVEKAHAQG